MKELIERLLELHKQGSQHPMDGGMVCVGCGGQWPCRTKRIIDDFAIEALTNRKETPWPPVTTAPKPSPRTRMRVRITWGLTSD